MKKIIIFGATGNVGSYVTKFASEYFDKNEYEIIASGRKHTSVFESMGVKYIPVDITNVDSFSALPTEDVCAVIHLAAQIPSYMDQYAPEKYIKSLILGTFNVLEYARKTKVDRMLFSTTVFDISLYAVDGNTLYPDMKPNFSYKGDHAVYVIAKNAAVELMEHYKQEYGIKKFVFRFPTIYGYSPYHYYYPNGVKTLRPVYKMIDQAMKGEPIELWGDPNYSKDMVHVYDCAQMLCKAIEADCDGGTFNVGTGKPITLREQIETIIEVFSPEDNRSQIIFRPEKKASGGFIMNVDNAKELLGYDPQYDCRALFEDYKSEMEVNRFAELRLNNEK